MKKIIALFLLIVVCACKNDASDTKKVTYPQEKKEIKPQQIDSTEIKISDLPIIIPNTDYVVHPVGSVRVSSGGRTYGVGTDTKNFNFTISNYGYPEITGELSNILFQHKDSTKMHQLTDIKMLIQSATYLDHCCHHTGKQILVYVVYDLDTNRDGVYNANDIKSLYISTSDGKNFTKLTLDMHELIDWKYVDPKIGIYFRSIEDINKNGIFDDQDKLHYYYLDLKKDHWKVEEYTPSVN